MSVTVTISSQSLGDAVVHRAVVELVDALSAFQARRVGGVAASAPARAPVRAPATADAATRYASFLEALPERSRQFLVMVEARGELGIRDAMAELGVPVGKAMGGITGSIARWAPEYAVSVPFEAVRGADGRRAWRWIGLDREPAPPVPVRRRRRRGVAQRAATAGQSTVASLAPDPVGATLEALPEDAAQLLRLVIERGEVSRGEALGALGLARAQALGSVLGPLEAALSEQGLAHRLTRSVDPLGDWTWRWDAAGEADEPRPPSHRDPAVGPGVRRRRSAAGGGAH